MITYSYYFNKIKLGLLKKNKKIFLKENKKSLVIIKLLIKYNIILGYKIYNKDIEVYKKNNLCVYLNLKVNFFDLKNLITVKNRRILRYKDLIRLGNKNTFTTYILSTPKGFLNIKESIKINTGGILIFRLN